MLIRSCKLVFACILALIPALALAQSEHRVQRVAFKNGQATINGRIRGHEYVDYAFSAGAGESLKVSLKTNQPSNYFNLLGPGETDTAFFVGSSSGDSYEGNAPTSGDYTARVYLMRNSARRGAVANYALRIVLGQTTSTQEKGPDYADGLTGGPDFWEVAGVDAGDTLSLRKAPSPRGQLVTRFPNGTVVRNLGCKNTRGQRWCRVEQAGAPVQSGWVNGRYLRESGGPR
jgi:hypothetical protein